MRPHLLAACLAVLLPVAFVADAGTAMADFDPTGRRKKPPPPPPGGAPTGKKPPPSGAKPPPTGAQPPPPTGSQPTGTQPTGPQPTGEGKDSKNPDILIARYKKALAEQPGAIFPLQRLAQLYRERDGNLKKLVEEFEQLVASTSGADQWSHKVALAGIYKQDGRAEDAIKTYEAAITEKPDDPGPILALAQIRMDRSDLPGARALYEKVLPLQKASADIESTLRQLMNLSLEEKDFDAAKKHHDALVKRSQSSLFVKAELGRALLERGHHDRAEAEFRELVKAASGDPRALAPALRDLGQALAKGKKTAEAVEVLRKALGAAGEQVGVRREILSVMTDAFRADGKLAELIQILEAEKASDFERLSLMGTLYEETGNVDKALDIYKKALAQNSNAVETRVRLVHLLQTAGQLDEAIKEYEALIKAAPSNSDYVFELCETLIQRGDRPKALKLLTDLESRAGDDDVILAAVADFYERVEEKDRAMKVLQRLATSTNGDPTHVIDLGDRYFQEGNKPKALETWARIKTIVPNRAKAAATLGEVYLDHDMPDEALAALREAVQLEPKNDRFKKALAIALERTATSLPRPAQRYTEAVAIWEEMLGAAGTNENLARESRTHIVTLWSLLRELPSRVSPLKARFEGKPPDLEAGRLLGEVLRKLNQLPEAEATLRKVTQLAPGDEQTLLALERILVQQQNLTGAIEVLEKLIQANPKRELQYLQRMVQYSADLFQDDKAIEFAERAIALSPNDANGHQKLGDMLRKKHDYPKAIASYRQAIAKNDRLFPVYFDLAELLLSSSEVEEADRLFRRVVRASADEDLVARAARLSMQINLGRGTLESLERELLPVAVGNPQKRIYRRLLIEVYGAMTFPLVQKVRYASYKGSGSGTPSATTSASVRDARAELARIGARAVKPLLDALADEQTTQQRVAIEVLAHIENKAAGPSLFNFATSTASADLRVRAMIACGALRDPDLLPKYEALLAPKEGDATLLPSDQIAVAAAWSVARLGTKDAVKLLLRLVDAPSPEVRALAAIGLGLSGDKKHGSKLLALARSPEAGPLVRAAAVAALGELGAGTTPGSVIPDEEARALLVPLASSADVELRRSALLALARLSRGKSDATDEAKKAIAGAVFATDADVRRDAVLAATVLVSGHLARSGDAMPVPDGPLTARTVLRALTSSPASAEARAQALVELAEPLSQAAVAAVSTSPERALVVADLLRDSAGSAGSGQPSGLGPFTEGLGSLTGPLAVKAAEVRPRIASAVVPAFAALVRHPDLEVRMRAVEILASREEPSAQAAVIDALGDPDEVVQRAALAAVGSVPQQATVQRVAKLLKDADAWSVRVRAAAALGRLASAGGSNASIRELATTTLADRAKGDPYALVREAALRALVDLDRTAGLDVARDIAKTDAEPRLRTVAKELGQSSAPTIPAKGASPKPATPSPNDSGTAP